MAAGGYAVLGKGACRPLCNPPPWVLQGIELVPKPAGRIAILQLKRLGKLPLHQQLAMLVGLCLEPTKYRKLWKTSLDGVFALKTAIQSMREHERQLCHLR